jgi:ribosomal protein S12 methylthiotransferase
MEYDALVQPQRAALISLGCAKNQVDSQIMASQILDLGYVLTEDLSEASVVIINTCGFLQSSVEEGLDIILEAARRKEGGVCEKLIVAGCMVQRYGRKLARSLPEVDLFLGTSHYHLLKEVIKEQLDQPDRSSVYMTRPRSIPAAFGSSRIGDTNPSSVYIRIADGCDNRCTFCMIPHLRGPFRSRPVESIVEEARLLAEAGAVEINLIAQDITAYGPRGRNATTLLTLLEALEDLDGIQWIRLLYAYPDGVTPDLLKHMRQSRKVLPYLDMPLQHCAPEILHAMRGRPFTEPADCMLRRIRDTVPHIALRTTLMVGFPGETDEHFQTLLSFVERSRFDHLGVFAFSPEPGTRAARLAAQVEPAVKDRRRHELLMLQKGISESLLSMKVGQILPVLVEGPHPETDLLMSGRLKSQAPEVDGTVLITSGSATPGEIVFARITRSHSYDVEAEIPQEEGTTRDDVSDGRSGAETF